MLMFAYFINNVYLPTTFGVTSQSRNCFYIFEKGFNMSTISKYVNDLFIKCLLIWNIRAE